MFDSMWIIFFFKERRQKEAMLSQAYRTNKNTQWVIKGVEMRIAVVAVLNGASVGSVDVSDPMLLCLLLLKNIESSAYRIESSSASQVGVKSKSAADILVLSSLAFQS